MIYGLAIDPTNGEIYVGDAIDFEQPGVVYRYRDTGQGAELVDVTTAAYVSGEHPRMTWLLTREAWSARRSG